MKTQFIPYEATHPGHVLKDELKAREINQKEFARDIDMQPSMLNELIKEKRAVTPEIALLLEKTLDIPADFWLNFQMNYELNSLRKKEKFIQKTEQIETWKTLKNYVPVAEFARLQLLSNSLQENISQILNIYESENFEKLKDDFLIFYKNSGNLQNELVRLYAWIKLSEWQAKNENTQLFNASDKFNIEQKLIIRDENNSLSLENAKRFFESRGIKFIENDLKNDEIEHYIFWSHNNPAIAFPAFRKNEKEFLPKLNKVLEFINNHLRHHGNEKYMVIRDNTKKKLNPENFSKEFKLISI